MKNKLRFLLAAAVLSVSLAGCSSGGSSDYVSYNSGNAAPAEAYGIADYEYKETADEEAYMPAPAAEDSGAAPVLSQEKMVYRGSLSIETLEYAETVKNIKERIRSYNGIVEAEEQYDNDRTWYNSGATTRGTCALNMTVRIPTESFEAFLDDMSGSGKVTSRTTNVENIASRKTCERLGCELERIADVPKEYRTLCAGATQKCRYIWRMDGAEKAYNKTR